MNTDSSIVGNGFRDLPLVDMQALGEEELGPLAMTCVRVLMKAIEDSSMPRAMAHKPFAQWWPEAVSVLIQENKNVLHALEILSAGPLPDEWCDIAQARWGISVIPCLSQREDHWFRHLERNSSLTGLDVPDHLQNEAFWLKALDYLVDDPSAMHKIDLDAQTPVLVDRMLELYGVEMDFSVVRADLLTDRVAGLLMRNSSQLARIDEEVLLRGMRWLLDNGHPSLFERRNTPVEHRTLDRLLNIFSWVDGNLNNLDYYQALEELRRYPQEDLAANSTDPSRIDLYRRFYGVEAASDLLGDEHGKLKRKWIEQDMGL